MPEHVSKRVLPSVAWIPTLYLAMGIPFAMVNWVVASMFKDMGYSDTSIMASTGSIVVVWSLKPFWAAFLDMFGTKRAWVLGTEFFLSVTFAGLSAAMRLPDFFTVITVLLWVIALASSMQDMCADGVYVTALNKDKQARWIGLQGVFWNGGRIFAISGTLAIAGLLKDHGLDPIRAWSFALGSNSFTMCILGVCHLFTLPAGALSDRPKNAKELVEKFADSMKTFVRKKSILGMLVFVGLYRTAEGFLSGEAPLFMQAPISAGGLGLTLQQKGVIEGTIGTTFSFVGGWLGGLFVAKYGLRKTLPFLAGCLNAPHISYLILSQMALSHRHVPLWLVIALVGIKKFGYTFGFTGNMLYMMQQIAPGKYKMVHYAFATAWMNLVLWPAQTLSGKLSDYLGYRSFFGVVLLGSIPSLIAAWKAPFPNPEDIDEGVGDITEETDVRAAKLAPQ